MSSMRETRNRRLSDKTAGTQMYTHDDISKLITESRDSILSCLKQEIKHEINLVKSKLESFDSRITSIEASLSKFQHGYSEMMSEISNLKGEVKLFKSEAVQDCTEEVEARCLRLNNIILFGVPEKEDGSVEERKDWDALRVGDILEEINVVDLEISDHRRLGKKHNNRARPLKVCVRDLEKKKEILRKSKNLRASNSMRDVYIKQDLTRAQQEQRKLLRQELAARKAAGDDDFVIYGNRVLSRKDILNFRQSVLL